MYQTNRYGNGFTVIKTGPKQDHGTHGGAHVETETIETEIAPVADSLLSVAGKFTEGEAALVADALNAAEALTYRLEITTTYDGKSGSASLCADATEETRVYIFRGLHALSRAKFAYEVEAHAQPICGPGYSRDVALTAHNLISLKTS